MLTFAQHLCSYYLVHNDTTAKPFWATYKYLRIFFSHQRWVSKSYILNTVCTSPASAMKYCVEIFLSSYLLQFTGRSYAQKFCTVVVRFKTFSENLRDRYADNNRRVSICCILERKFFFQKKRTSWKLLGNRPSRTDFIVHLISQSPFDSSYWRKHDKINLNSKNAE